MKIIDIIKTAIESKECRFAFEMLPPLKGDNIETIFNTIDTLYKFNPAYINVTYHREDIKYVERPDGLIEKRIASKRPGTVAISASIKAKYGVEVVPHLICGGFTAHETEDALIDLNFLSINNVLALRGDTLKGENCFSPTKGGHGHAIDLVEQISAMNRGIYLDSEVENITHTDFCTGVAGYPEKHSEAANPDIDIEYLKKKVDAGADYIVTQMFFDNNKFFDFADRCLSHGINVPIIPGIKPLSTKKQITTLPQIFHVDIPQKLTKEVIICDNNKQVRDIGTEWALQQCLQLKKYGVPVLHFYTMGKADNIESIASQIFK